MYIHYIHFDILKETRKRRGSAFFRRLHIPNSDRAGQNIQLNFLSWNEKKGGKKWIIDDVTLESSFFFSFGLIQSQNWRMGARKDAKRYKMNWISISAVDTSKSKRSRIWVCTLSGSLSLSLTYLECIVFPYMFKQIDPGGGNYSFIHRAIITI